MADLPAALVRDRLVKAGRLAAQLTAEPSFALSGLGAGAGLGGGPVFEVEIDGETLPAAGWRLVEALELDGGLRFVLAHGGKDLRAALECVPSHTPHAVSLRLGVSNHGGEPVTATVRFPTLHEVVLGSVEDTWYLAGRRGGIISRQRATFREPLGEPHPLQVDGFLNPRPGTRSGGVGMVYGTLQLHVASSGRLRGGPAKATGAQTVDRETRRN